MYSIGIDIGGTEIKSGVIKQNGEIVKRLKRPTSIKLGRDGILTSIQHIVKELCTTYPEMQAIGIGSAGRIDVESGKVIYATGNLPGWTGVQIKKILEAEVGLPVYVNNDVNVAAIGEARFGVGRGVDEFLLLTIGTGIGGAYLFHGDTIQGVNGSFAEVGHMILYPNGHTCNCGQHGCVEQYISGTALNRRIMEVAPEWTSYDLMNEYTQSNEKAIQIMETYLFDLSTTIVTLQNLFDPEMVVIGGGFGTTSHLWIDKLREIIANHTNQSIDLKQAILGNDAGIIGAASMAFSQ
ncbi:ROK family protein [Pseudogracilibacillus auburnensis]|uniref:Glucokinase n=1 Tax=Pseudogracilibacillus auburnensis TaxID=1494959 RepID=A0A2V3WD09_9BACI|nr:ROK family protein [Pseudogracilibacillus auburnensis]PXW90105.1 glucokinase [Pseudogracilibacillus auburnensis]